jgi:hypothetical protein
MTMQLPIGLSLATINQPPTADEWMDEELAVAGIVLGGLPSTSFEPGSPERVVFATVANMLQQDDVAGSMAIQGGFLNFAAFGTVSWTDATGAQQTAFVTPDPSVPAQNPTGQLGWLDVLADGHFDVQRVLATPAGGALALLNTGATTYGPFAAGTFHVSQPNAPGAPTYTNTAAFSIPQSASIGTVTATAESAGPGSAVKLTASGAWTIGQVVFVNAVGGTVESNGAWTISATDGSTYLVLSGSVYANAWTGGGTIYTPTQATCAADVAGTSSNATTPNAVTHPITSLIGVSIGNYAQWLGSNTEGNASVVNRCQLKLASLNPNGVKGAYAYFALTAITLGPTLNPPVTVSSAIISASVTSLNGVVTVTLANAAGPPSAADVIAVDTVIQSFADPIGVSEYTQACSVTDITITVSITVPNNFTTIATPVIQTAVQTYFGMLPVGGITDVETGTNVVPIGGVSAAIAAACSSAQIPVRDLSVTLNNAYASIVLSDSYHWADCTNAYTFIPTVYGY